jgi:hypothetical protein
MVIFCRRLWEAPIRERQRITCMWAMAASRVGLGDTIIQGGSKGLTEILESNNRVLFTLVSHPENVCEVVAMALRIGGWPMVHL